MGHWTPTGVEPKDYDDDDETSRVVWRTCSQLSVKDSVAMQQCSEVTIEPLLFALQSERSSSMYQQRRRQILSWL